LPGRGGILDWHKRAIEIKKENPKLTNAELTEKLNSEFDEAIGYEAVRKYMLRSKGKITFEDKKEFTVDDIDEYAKKVHELQKAMDKLNTKQVKATFEIDDDKPVAIAHWGDWHEGALGVNYDRLDEDTETIINTDGLYWIGMGDYKDNYLTGGHAGAQYEQIIQPGMQDLLVKRRMERTADNCIALVRGCHDDWDKKTGDKDFLTSMCEVTNAINLWHGGDLYIKFGQCDYHWKVRHKYKYESTLNLENAMRRIMEMQGPCDVAASAHLHNPYFMERHLMGEFRIMLRSGSYKIWDEFGQKLAGYKGKAGVPVIIIFPDSKRMIPLMLEEAIPVLAALRK
jgi:hypothetical protein